MAITARASGTGSGGSGSATTATVTRPSGVASGDVLIAVVSINGNKTPTAGDFTQLLSSGDANHTSWIGYRVAGGSEPASYNICSWTGADAYGAAVATYVGVDNTTPADAATPAYTTGSSTTITCSSITTATDLAWALACATDDSATATFTATPGGYTDRVQKTGGSGRAAAIADKEITPAGATGTVTYTISVGVPWRGTHVALRPAAAGGASIVPIAMHTYHRRRAA